MRHRLDPKSSEKRSTQQASAAVGDQQPGPARAVTARGRPNVAVENRVPGAGRQGRRGDTSQDRGSKSAVGVAERPPGGQGRADGTDAAPPAGEDQKNLRRPEVLQAVEDSNLSGPEALAQFNRAPAATRAAFWGAIRKRTERSHRESRKRVEEAAELGFTLLDFLASVLLEPPELRHRRDAVRIWGKRWRDRAFRDRLIEQRGRRVDDGFDAEKARLEGIDAADYVFRLIGAEPNRAGYVHCPLPDHDDRTPSFHCRDTRWRCYGCNERGSIYDLAGILWDLPRSGREFRLIHERLLEVFG